MGVVVSFSMSRKKLFIPNEKALVTKHNKLIQAKYSLTLQEKRLIYWLISEIKPEDGDFKPYRVAIKELTAFLGLENNNRIYQQMAEVTERLMRRVMKIEEPENKSLLQVAWVSSARYHLGKGCVDISFDPQLKPYLVQLKNQFTSIELRYAIHLQSVYAMRIYELLKQYRKIGERVLPIAELREMLGIEAHKYQYINDFRRFVIDIAQREINGKTDIRFDYFELKQGRKITDIRFVIAANTPAPEPEAVPAELPGATKLTRQLEAHGVGSTEVARLLADYDAERITWHIGELERRLRGTHKIKNPAAWLVQGIRADYRPQQSMFAQEEAQRRAAAHTQTQRAEEIRAILTKLSKAYRKHLLPVIETFLQELRAKAAEEYEFITQEFQATLQSDFAREQFRKSGWGEPTIFNDAASFFCQRYPAAFHTRAAFARHHNLGNPELLAAELADLESAG
jgi:Initiator Replication protein